MNRDKGMAEFSSDPDYMRVDMVAKDWPKKISILAVVSACKESFGFRKVPDIELENPQIRLK